MLVPGLDKALAGKEIGKRYEVMFDAREGFGERRIDLVKTIPLKIFTEKNIAPYPGLALAMDNMTARVIAVSGARVITDFNNPLAGKALKYDFIITRIVTDEQEKARALFEISFKSVPEFIIGEKIVVIGAQILEAYAKAFSPLFKELLGKELAFELKTPPTEETSSSAREQGQRNTHADEKHGHVHAHSHTEKQPAV
jgi:FKBP-type peptidyl-prolyl cis-trans isomerase 2